MSLASALNPLFSRAEFRQMEIDATDEVRLERIDGYVYSMAGAGMAQERVVSRCVRALGDAADRHGCEVYASNRRLSIGQDTDLLPDVSVYCDPTDDDEYAGQRPCLIVEVLSPSTALNDLNLKVPRYQQVESVETIMLINTEPIYAEVFTRADGDWSRQHFSHPDDVIELSCPPCRIPLSTFVAR